MVSNQEKFLEQMGANCVAAINLCGKKNTDYATSADPFLNFRESAAFAGTSVEQGIMTRLGDKFTRVKNLLSRAGTPAVADESIADTLLDAMNYTNILLCYLQTEAPAEDETPELLSVQSGHAPVAAESAGIKDTLKSLFGLK